MNLQTAFDGIGKGFLEPILSMNHLLFCLTAGLVLFTLRKRPYEIGLFLVAQIPGYVLEWSYSTPAVLVNVGVALTVAIVLLLHWFYEKLATYTIPLLLLAGFFHGLSFAKTVSGHGLPVYWGYATAATLVQGLLMFGFGAFCRRISIKAPDSYEDLENLLSASGAGVALAYFFLAF